MTLSIAARCARTGQFGVAVFSSSPAVAARCAFARAGIGAVTTQNVTDPRLGPAALDLLARGLTAAECRDVMARTASHAAFRQMTMVDAQGNTAAWSGAGTLGTHGQALRENVVSAGNLLASSEIPDIAAEAFLRSDADLELGLRLILALEAGLEAGGEAGPIHSAGLVVADREAWPLADLRVDWHETAPLSALHALWDVWVPQMYDYVKRAITPEAAPSYGVPGDE